MSKHVETTHPQKIMGLYVNLKKALDALDAAGEMISLYEGEAIGILATVSPHYNGEWTVVQN